MGACSPQPNMTEQQYSKNLLHQPKCGLAIFIDSILGEKKGEKTLVLVWYQLLNIPAWS
jgi:hypothetical protein